MDKVPVTPESLGMCPEIIDATAHVQAAHAALCRLPETLSKRDLLEEFGDDVNTYLSDLGDLRHDLLRLMSDIAALTWQ